jgi:phosphoribosylaminoimidazolecarboxamide formyltransferase/IMP cyclohydrolase
MQKGARTHLLARVEQLQGRPLSFNNLADLSAARLLILELDSPAAVIVKHGNPCGVGLGESVDEAYAKALASDPVSAYGGVVVLNRAVGPALGKTLASQFVEVVFAPGYDEAALEELATKERARVLVDGERRAFVTSERDFRRVLGGLLVQDRDAEGDPLDAMDVACGDPDPATWEELLFAWTVAKHVTSNAIVVTRGGQTLGIGAGQMSRVDAVRIAVEKAGDRAGGAVLASDAFFPFDDGPRLAFGAGVAAAIQPGGSVRDEEVIAAANDRDMAMIFTGIRHFRH